MRYVTFALLSRYLLNMSRAWLFVFNARSSIYSKSPFTPKSVMNKPQAEGKVISRLYSRTQENKFNTLIKHNKTQLVVYLKSFLLISMVELDQGYSNLAREIHFRADFSSKPNQTHLSMLICLQDNKKITGRWVWSGLELNSAKKSVSHEPDLSITELDHQRSAAKTSVNKMRCCLTYLINAGLRHILSLHFTVLIIFDEYWICFFVRGMN